MIFDFSSFLNEAAGKRFPAYKVGDHVIIKTDGYATFITKRELSSKWDKFWKVIFYKDSGVYGKIAEIDEEKKEYTVEAIDGVVETSTGSSRHSNTTPSKAGDSWMKYIKVKQKDLTTEGVKEIEKFIKEAKYKAGNSVAFETNGKIAIRKVVGLQIMKSLENNEPTYKLEGLATPFKETDLEEETDLDKDSQNAVADEIAKTLGIKIEETNHREFSFSCIKMEGEKLITGKLYFKDVESRNTFLEDLKKFVESNLNKDLQKIMNEGEPAHVSVKTPTTGPIYSWERGSVKREKVVQAAKNIGIKVKEFLHSKRGTLSGKKFGI